MTVKALCTLGWRVYLRAARSLATPTNGTRVAFEASMPAVCLIGDDSGPLRQLMRDALSDAGYQVVQAESSTALAALVHERSVASAAEMLLVLGARWASQCAIPISVAATLRQQLNLSPVSVVLLYELGTLGILEGPELHHCRTVAMLEKPFEMDVLKEAAREAATQART